MRESIQAENEEVFLEKLKEINTETETFTTVIPSDKILATSLMTEEDVMMIGDNQNERDFFRNLIPSIIQFTFNQAVKTKYEFITYIADYVLEHPGMSEEEVAALHNGLQNFISLRAEDDTTESVEQ